MPSPAVLRTAYRPAERHARHAHAVANVSVVLSGSLIERVGRAEVVAGPLSVVVKPAGTDHADIFGPHGAVLLQLPVPAPWPATFTDGAPAVDRWRWVRSPEAARWLLRLAVSPAACSGAGAVDDAIAECLGAICELRGDDETDAVPGWLARVRERIRDERGRGAGVRQLAREADVHPVYLARRFRRAYGCSVVGMIQAERVRAAAGALASSAEPIARVAFATGFADQPHLTRLFRRVAGLTPAAYRRLAHGGPVGNVQDWPRAPG